MINYSVDESDFSDVLRSVLDILNIWNDLGLELGLKISELNVIERDKSTSKDRIRLFCYHGYVEKD